MWATARHANTMRHALLRSVVLFAALSGACESSPDTANDAAMRLDATSDGAAPGIDASEPPDARVPAADGGSDASADAASADAALDAAHDAGAMLDTGSDPGTDYLQPEIYLRAYDVLAERCAFCHVRGGFGWKFGRLDLSTPERAYDQLVGHAAVGSSCLLFGLTRVIPNDSARSLLVSKVDSSAWPPCGVPMPDHFESLSVADVDKLRDWIDAGAPGHGAPVVTPPSYPALLSQTGLFSDINREILAPGVRVFAPRYGLWSDADVKRRWLYLPPDQQIDTSNMDYWVYPVGTKVWKEFTTISGDRIETRLIEKVAPSTWLMIAYEWPDPALGPAPYDAVAVPDGVVNSHQGSHEIPSQEACTACHDHMTDKLLGVTAIQLSHQGEGVTLKTLVEENRLSHPPIAPFMLPPGPYGVAADGLGVLHANCGHCHNPRSAVNRLLEARLPVSGVPDLWERTSRLGSVEDTIGYTSTVLQPSLIILGHIVEPGYAERSELFLRMDQRGGTGSLQMPPLATALIDNDGLDAVRLWIESLPPVP